LSVNERLPHMGRERQRKCPVREQNRREKQARKQSKIANSDNSLILSKFLPENYGTVKNYG